MNIYLVDTVAKVDYDQYDSFVVVADSEEEAKATHPSTLYGEVQSENTDKDDLWTPFKDIRVELIGVADSEYKEKTVICSSFNAG